MGEDMQRQSNLSDVQSVSEIIACDDKDEFLSVLDRTIIVDSGELMKLKLGESELCPYELLHQICYHGAVRCGKALLEGKDGLTIDLNVSNSNGVFPLHAAACSLSSSLVDLFLQHGAQTNCKVDGLDSEKGGLLPLHIALEMLRCDNGLRRWKPERKESIFDLIIMLCFPRMHDSLETIRLLAWKTEAISDVLINCALTGKIIELAALLMVAREKVMGPISCQSVDSTDVSVPFFQFVRTELAVLVDLECYLIGRGSQEQKELYELCKARKSAMLPILPLFQLFEKAGDIIENYRQLRQANIPEEQVAEDVARHLVEAGFSFKYDGFRLRAIGKSSFHVALEPATDLKEDEKEDIEVDSEDDFGQQDINAPFHSKHYSSLDTKREVYFKLEDNLESTLMTCKADYKCGNSGLEQLKIPPLFTTLEKLSTCEILQLWTPKQSILKLIIMLCLPQMKQVIETARALELNAKEVSSAACYCAMEGKLIELAILLMVARVKAMGPVCAYEEILSSETPITFRQFVRRELVGLVDLEVYLRGRPSEYERTFYRLCRKRKLAMLSVLPLLEIFEKAGVAIEYYLQSRPDDVQEADVVQDVARLFADAGFKLKLKDIDLSDIPDRTSATVVLNEKDNSIHVIKGDHVMLFDNAKDGTRGVRGTGYAMLPPARLGSPLRIPSKMASNIQKCIFARQFPGSFAFYSKAQEFRTPWTSRDIFSCGLRNIQVVQGKGTGRAEQQMQKFLATKWFYAFALAIKKGIKGL